MQPPLFPFPMGKITLFKERASQLGSTLIATVLPCWNALNRNLQQIVHRKLVRYKNTSNTRLPAMGALTSYAQLHPEWFHRSQQRLLRIFLPHLATLPREDTITQMCSSNLNHPKDNAANASTPHAHNTCLGGAGNDFKTSCILPRTLLCPETKLFETRGRHKAEKRSAKLRAPWPTGVRACAHTNFTLSPSARSNKQTIRVPSSAATKKSARVEACRRRLGVHWEYVQALGCWSFTLPVCWKKGRWD